MPRFIEKLDQITLPVIPLRGIVVFPVIPISIEISDEKQAALCSAAGKDGSQLFFVMQKDASKPHPSADDLYTVGCCARIKQYIKLPDGSSRIVVEGVTRGTASYIEKDGILTADIMCKTILVEGTGDIRGEALMREVHVVFDNFRAFLPKISPEILTTVKGIKTPEILSDFIACNLLISADDKQQVLEEFDPLRRLERLALIMERETEILRTEQDIHRKVRSRVEHNQREYYLREQLRTIQNELGMNGQGHPGTGESTGDEEIDEYIKRIKNAKLPEEVNERCHREIRRLLKTQPTSPEAAVIKTYLDTILDIPWTKRSNDRTDVAEAKRILDRDHDGLEKVKERILEFIAVRQLNPELKNQILCLVGPPGTGKTSIGASIAKAMRRKYVRVSLGGVRDEADIRGHRKTYIASMPGRIIEALIRAGTRNPLILLDEVDKLTSDARGDPASALLEVLDSEQNKAFRDHYCELPVDLSECLFICTANTLDTVPRPLVDRMEIIELKTYTRYEKLSIAKNHLLPKQIKRHGLSKRQLKLTDEAILEIIDHYTLEAGVRNLERELAAVCRKAAKEIVEDSKKKFNITPDQVSKFLGHRKVKPDKPQEGSEVGVVNGLAYTPMGGDMLKIECAALPGTGKLELTGSLGEVMKESAHAAVSYIRSRASDFGIDPDFYKTKDIHIHVPEGAVPKDGPSAGVTLVTAITSELSGRPVLREVAMTGEITLRGRVLAVGGLREKTMAAYKAGVKTVLIPEDNIDDLEDIDATVRGTLKFIPCSDVSQVLDTALVPTEEINVCPSEVGTEAAAQVVAK